MNRFNTGDRREFGRRVAAIAGLVCLAGADVPNRISPGPGASLGGRRPFPDNDLWNRDVSRDPVDPNSEALLQSIGLEKGLHPDFGTVYQGAPIGIPYVVVPGNQPRLPLRFAYPHESDPGPYPIPANPPIEGGPQATGDRHILVIDRDRWRLYELFDAHRDGQGWRAGSGAVWDLAAHSATQRPDGWTSADAAGLPIFPGLVRYDEVHEQKAIRHALRFTCVRTRHAYVAPARHYASRLTDPNLPPMGMRVRLKAGYDVSRFPKTVQVILEALKRHGMLLADNGGNWFLSGAPDPRWNDDDLGTLRQVQGRDLEVVRMGAITTR
ncbi:MAG: hypothetical protein ABI353_02105 [Isosphaeraceae bacterium]